MPPKKKTRSEVKPTSLRASAPVAAPKATQVQQSQLPNFAAVVDPMCNRRDKLQLYVERRARKDVTIWAVCVCKANDSFLLQLLAPKGAVDGTNFGIWMRWGNAVEATRFDEFKSIDEAKSKFAAHYEKLTGNKWSSDASQRGSTFVLKPGKYIAVAQAPEPFFSGCNASNETDGSGFSDEESGEEVEELMEEEEADEDEDDAAPEELGLRDPFADDAPAKALTKGRAEESSDEEDSDDDGVVDNDRDYINLCAAKVEKKPESAEAWFDLALAMADGSAEATEVKGKLMTILQVHVKAVELAPENDPDTWCNLGATMNAGDKVIVRGTEYTQIQVRQKAVQLVPDDSLAWNNLGFALPPGQSVNINGTAYSKLMCCQKAIELDEKDSTAYDTLGVALLAESGADSQCQPTPSSSSMTPFDCFARSLSLERNYPWAWVHMGQLLRIGKGNAGNNKELFHFRGKDHDETSCYRHALAEDAEEFAAELLKIEPEVHSRLAELKLVEALTDKDREEHEAYVKKVMEEGLPPLPQPAPSADLPKSPSS